MSDENSIDWFRTIVFGSATFKPETLPREMLPIALEIEERKIDFNSALRNGGLVGLSVSLIDDLERIVAFVQEGGDDPHLQTPVVADFFNRLSASIGRRLERRRRSSSPSSSLLRPDDTATTSDWILLNKILKNEDEGIEHLDYRDARFWGELTRKLVHLQRPFDPSLYAATTTTAIPHRLVRDAVRLYDVTCKKYGRTLDPFTMVMVSRDDHVDPVHWSTPELFRRFLKDDADHPLSSAVKHYVFHTVLEADGSQVPKEWRLTRFFENVRHVHESIPAVRGSDVPPRLVDVYHRLLALADKKRLWSMTATEFQKTTDHHHDDAAAAITTTTATHFNLYTRVLELERENRSLSIRRST
ncbi:putative cytochrome p450 305a1 [Lasius niger]|uniref:Putative cytochrome p450 305a1 n=1 Tax=Lasius niger TaxID=67767 RepID=A0A0J7K0N4_LASNI|nr:putative cytochrome p450 305a1 [Lasius niger]